MNNHIALIGMDVGNTNLKAIAFNTNGQVLVSRSRPTLITKRAKIYVENRAWNDLIDPQLLWEEVQELLTDLINQLGKVEVRGLAVTGMGGPTVALDHQFRPVYPVISPWPIDDADTPLASVADAFLYQTTGYHLHNSPLTTLSWLVRHDSQRFSRTSLILSVESYISFRLTGQIRGEPSTASGSGAWDQRRRTWADDIIKLAGISRNVFPPIVEPGTPIGPLSPQVAQATRLPEKTMVVMGGHDYLCAAAALGVTNPGKILNVLGTYEIIASPHSQEHQVNPSPMDLIDDTHVYPGMRCLMFQMIGAGHLEWLKRLLTGGITDDSAKNFQWETLQHKAAMLKEEDMENLVFAPFLFGRFFPDRCIYPHGAFIGLSHRHSPEHLYRSVIDALSYTSMEAFHVLKDVIGAEPSEVVVTGGGVRNMLWLQRKADFLQTSLIVPDIPDASALGAALLAGIGNKIYNSLDEGISAIEVRKSIIEPRAPISDQYRELFLGWNEIIPRNCAHFQPVMATHEEI
jgi:xylulokinase